MWKQQLVRKKDRIIYPRFWLQEVVVQNNGGDPTVQKSDEDDNVHRGHVNDTGIGTLVDSQNHYRPLHLKEKIENGLIC